MPYQLIQHLDLDMVQVNHNNNSVHLVNIFKVHLDLKNNVMVIVTLFVGGVVLLMLTTEVTTALDTASTLLALLRTLLGILILT